MGGDEEGQERRLVLIKIPTKELGNDDTVPQAGDRKKFSDALDEAKYYGLNDGDHARTIPRRDGRKVLPASELERDEPMALQMAATSWQYPMDLTP